MTDLSDTRRRIGAEIRGRRMKLGLTQLDLAERTGLQRPHVSRIEHGTYSVGLDTLALIADKLGCSLEIVPDVPETD